MNDLQKKLAEMMEWLDGFCRRNELTYYAVGGTLLGAARHQGFIPWDDDIDVSMPRKDYNRLIELLREPVEHYVVESPKNRDNPDFLYSYAKFYDTNTTMSESINGIIKRGVAIDIFPLDGMGNTYEEALGRLNKVGAKYKLLLTRVCKVNNNRRWYKNAAIYMGRLIPAFIINNRKLCSQIDEMAAELDYDECRFVGTYTGSYWEKEIIDKAFFGNSTDLPFEGFKIKAPEFYDKYLTNIFGDWRKLPPKEKQVSNHDFVDLDLNKPYREV